MACFDSVGVSEWEDNFIVNKLVDVDGVEGITALTLGMPYIPHEQSENRLGCNFRATLQSRLAYFDTFPLSPNCNIVQFIEVDQPFMKLL